MTWLSITPEEPKDGEVVALLGPKNELALGKRDPASPTGWATLPLQLWYPEFYARFDPPPPRGIEPAKAGIVGLQPTVLLTNGKVIPD